MAIPPGSPWCAGFVRWVLDRGAVPRGLDVRDARGAAVRSGVTTAWLRGAGRIEARAVERGLVRPPRGSVVVWRSGASWTGHAGVLDWWDARCGVTVEGNTSPPSAAGGRAGSGRSTAGQRDGDGVWVRNRCVSPGSHFRIVGFVPVRARGPA